MNVVTNNRAPRGPLHLREINRARDYYNPLRGLDIPRLVRLLEQGDRGQFSDLQKLNAAVEPRYYVLRALKARRQSALEKLDWTIKTPDPDDLPPGATEAQAKAQAEFLSAAYYSIENLPAAIAHLALATFRGYAHLEPRHQDDKPGLPIVRLQPVPQMHWFRDPETWGWRYDPQARDNLSTSTAIDPAQFIIREVEDPICQVALLCRVRANMSAKDWDAFCEDYNLPSVFFALGENTPPDKVAEWLALAEKVTGNSRGALPPGGEIMPLELGGDGAQFEKHMLWQEREVVLAGTGGLLTMIAESGSGTLAGSAHQDAFDQLAQAEAMQISAILQAQFDKPLLAREFPSQPPLAYFELAAEDTEDLDAFAERLAKLKTAGLEADEEEVSEKFGITLRRAAPVAPAPGEPTDPTERTNPNQPPLKNRATIVAAGNDERFLARSVRQIDSADLAGLKPVLDRMLALDAIEDPAEFAAAVLKFRRDLPDLEDQVLAANPDLEEAFAEVIGTAFASGLGEQRFAENGKSAGVAQKSPRKAGAENRGNTPSNAPQGSGEAA